MKLLPCPFCGGEPEEDGGMFFEFYGHERQDYSIACKKCRAEVRCDVGEHEGADAPCSCHHDTRKICAEKWNRRAAMLQGADGYSPDGWVACSERMPEKGRILALFGKRTKENCDPYVDEGYLGSDGEFYFFDWESGPRIDDCHPYDKAIVSHWMYWELPAAPQQEVK